MAAFARITPVLLPATRQRSPLLRQGPSRQLGPVSVAIQVMREAEPDPVDAILQAIQDALDRYFAEAGIKVDLDAALRSAGGAA
ncbi:hypothetical protein [Methylobacterium sp. GC_Met_2]|uniref:hypothetical protein n=1 Tax=Methylobacterium sp. GC_Met_2 TaxID=2937376 RepID=UPI00226BA147|nr:hypothetical protein [Methylobacterium sp. GC_Met_2]